MFNKFKNWMKFNPPEIDTPEGWCDFEIRYENEAPIRHWIMKGPLYSFKNKIKFKLEDAKMHIANKFMYKPHLVQMDIPKKFYFGNSATRLLRSSFTILEEYVEIELVKKWYPQKMKRKGLGILPKLLRLQPAYKKGSDWADISILNEINDSKLEGYGEMFKLYEWWKDERPYRELPNMPKTPHKPNNVFGSASKEWQENYPEEWKNYREWYDECDKLQKEWDDEDQEMLTRLSRLYNIMSF